MLDYINKLREKPLHARKRLMWVGVALSGALLFVVWFWSLDALISQPIKTANQPDSEELDRTINELKTDLPSLWQSLGAGIGTVINEIGQEGESSASPSASESALLTPSPTESAAIDGQLPVE